MSCGGSPTIPDDAVKPRIASPSLSVPAIETRPSARSSTTPTPSGAVSTWPSCRALSHHELAPRGGARPSQRSSTIGSERLTLPCRLGPTTHPESQLRPRLHISASTICHPISPTCPTNFSDGMYSSNAPLSPVSNLQSLFSICPVLPPMLYIPTSRAELVECGRLGCWLRRGWAVGQGKKTQKCSFGYSRWVSTQTSTRAAYSFTCSR